MATKLSRYKPGESLSESQILRQTAEESKLEKQRRQDPGKFAL